MKRVLVILAMFVLVAPLAAVPEPTAEELQANRRRFEQLRKQHPEVVAKLRAESEVFHALDKARRRQIVQIHKELQKEPAESQARLTGTLDRYADWLQHLDETTRKQIVEAPDKQKRLDLIRDLREQEWVKDQPRAVREQLAKLQGDARKAFIAKQKEGERQRRLEWVIASRFWNELENKRPLPARFTELPGQVRFYVSEYLQKMYLSAEENEQLKKAEGQWPQYPMKLVALADKHPPALAGPQGPKSFSELPLELYNKEFLRDVLPKFLKKDPPNLAASLAKQLRIPEGKWPEFGIELAKVAKQRGHIFKHEFLAYNFDCLNKPMQDFMKNKLEPVLLADAKGTYRLTNAIGKWPDYPQTIQELSEQYHLRAPWYVLPAGASWENYRLVK